MSHPNDDPQSASIAVVTQENVETPQKAKLLTRPVLEWAAWDWGSAAFHAVATTFVFSVYLTSDGLFTDEATAGKYLSIGLAVAGLIIALFAPVTGQRADREGKGGRMLGIFTAGVVVCMGLMFFIYPENIFGPIGALWAGIILLGLGSIFIEFATVNYNAMLNHLSDDNNAGRISGLGWGMGYVGGIVLLLILFVGFINPEVGWFGVTSENGMNIRVSMLIAAAWFALFALPVSINPPKPKNIHGAEESEPIWVSYQRLFGTVKSLVKESPNTLRFLIASAVFRDGLAGIFTFGGIIAATAFDFSRSEVIIFAIASNIVAGVATITFGSLDDVIGPKRVIVLSLVSMVAASAGIFLLHDYGSKVFWVLGLILCIFVGPAQSSSRSLLSRMIPEGREGEVFGLYATTGRAVSFLAPAMYGLSLALGGWITGGNSTHWGVIGIALILLLGLVLVLPIRTESESFDNV